MAQATPNLDFIEVPSPMSAFVNMLRKIYRNLVTNVINGHIGYGDGTKADNIDGVWANVTAPVAPNTDFTITHNLGRLPVGYWVMQKDRACDVYTGSVAATKTQITLRATVASAVLRLFIIGLLLSFAAVANAQTTSVTLQVTDASSQIWSNGSWSVLLVSKAGAANFGPPFNIIGGGGPVPNQAQSGALDPTGTGLMTLTPNASIVPAQSQWRFTVCPQATSPCFTTAFVIAGATQTVLPVPPAILISCETYGKTYQDSQVQCTQGGLYYNLTTGRIRTCQTSTPPNTCLTWADVGAGTTVPGGSPIQTQVNNGGVFGGTPCQTFPSLSIGPVNVDCDWHPKGLNPYVDVTRFGARPFVANALSTTASCNGTTSITLNSAIDFINGDGIVLHKCGPVPSLATPGAPTNVIPKGIINGATTASYEIVAEDFALGMTAAGPATTITTSASVLGATTANINSVSITAAGLATFTTAANHNFQTLSAVKLTGVSCMNGVWTINTTPTSTTFTINVPTTFGTSLITACGLSSATAQVFAKNRIYWAVVPGAMRYWIYRQDGGAGNYNIVGVAQGIEPYFEDLGFGINTGNLTPEVPLIAPVSAANQALATKIVSGAGTTSLVVANATTNTISGVTTLHDNTVAVLAAFNSLVSLTGSGIFFPAPTVASTGYLFNFPLVFTYPGFSTKVWASTLFVNQPIVPTQRMKWDSFGSGGMSGSFAKSAYANMNGLAMPIMLFACQSNSELEHLSVTAGSLNYQIGVLLDTCSNGNGTATSAVNILNSYMNGGQQASLGLMIRGEGFDYIIDHNIFSCGITNFEMSPSVRIMASSLGPAIGWPGIATFDHNMLIGGGIQFDSESLNGGNVAFAGSPWRIFDTYTESLCQAFFTGRGILSNNWFNLTIDGLVNADSSCGGQTPTVDLGGSSLLIGFHIKHIGGNTQSYILTTGGATSNTTIESESYNDAPVALAAGFSSQPSGYYLVGENNVNFGLGTGVAVRTVVNEVPGGIRLTPGASLIFSNVLAPTNVTAALVAGGGLAGNAIYQVTTVDADGGESSPSAPSTQITFGGGNNQAQISWTNATDPFATCYHVYRNGGRVTNPCTQSPFTDNLVACCFGSLGVQSGAGDPRIDQNGLWAKKLVLPGGTIGTLYSTASATGSANLTLVSMATAGTGGSKYTFSAVATQVVAGTSCTGNTLLGLTVNYTDPVTNSAVVATLSGNSDASAAYTASQILASGNGGPGQHVYWLPVPVNAKASTAVTYTVTYTLGTGCSPGPTYYFQPVLIQVQ